jgi:segregation and condensation protein B
VPEISDIRGVDSSGVIATLLERKLITTAGRKAVIGRPILYKTTKEFLLRFGLKDVNELPSMEEFEKLVSESFQSDLWPLPEAASATGARADFSPHESAPGDLASAESDQAGAAETGESAELDQAVATGENDPAA